MNKTIYLAFIAIAFGCETTFIPELNDAEEILVIDAWINRKMERQNIYITRSQPYFENSFPEKITDAEVSVEDLNTGTIYNFVESQDSYYWDPLDSALGVIGHNYRLTVTVEGETFEAFSRLGRVPPIDSIRFNYFAADMFVKEEYFKAEFLATDPVGEGDTYWIKAWKNGVYLGKPSELNMVYDAGFSAGQALDGQPFFLMIRQDFISPFDEIPGTNNEFYPPYLIGDSVYVEIHSIDPQAYEFLWGVYYYISRPGGFAELFSTPLANATTNLTSIDENSVTNVAGFFNVSAVSSAGKCLTQEIADRARQAAQ